MLWYLHSLLFTPQTRSYLNPSTWCIHPCFNTVNVPNAICLHSNIVWWFCGNAVNDLVFCKVYANSCNITLLICTWPLLNQLWSTTSYQNIHMVSLLWYAWWPPVVDLLFSLQLVSILLKKFCVTDNPKKFSLYEEYGSDCEYIILCLPYICGQVNPPNLHTLQCIASLLV